MSDDNDPLNKFLDLVPAEPEQKLPAVIDAPFEVVDEHDHTDEDFDDARDTIDAVLEQGLASFETFAKIAEQSQHPRAFEVLSTMMKTIGDLATAKLDAAEKRKKIKGLTNKGEGGEQVNNKTINNTVFIGSTAALQKYLDENPVPVIEDKVTVIDDELEGPEEPK